MANLLDGVGTPAMTATPVSNGKKVVSVKTDKDGMYEVCEVDKETYDEFVGQKKKINKKNKIAQWASGVGLTALGAVIGMFTLKKYLGSSMISAIIGASVGLVAGACGIDLSKSLTEKKIIKLNKEFVDKNS